MKPIDLAIVDTGSANLASVTAAFRRLGARPRVTESPERVLTARRVVLPGVGAFGAVAERLARTGLAEALRDRTAQGAALLGICLGMQLLAEGSDEAPGAIGLGVIEGKAERFGDGTRVPQLGWNRVEPGGQSRFVTPGYAYFANSFCLRSVPSGWSTAFASYDGSFVAAAERGPQLACQFHPELSGAWGAALLGRWYSQC
jgi:glutamine amidotransferase